MRHKINQHKGQGLGVSPSTNKIDKATDTSKAARSPVHKPTHKNHKLSDQSKTEPRAVLATGTTTKSQILISNIRGIAEGQQLSG
jgi:endonuclease/exonuclease/phosphatase family metal-dependent hydrolase